MSTWLAANGLRLAGWAIFLLALVGAGAYVMHRHDAKAYDKLETTYLNYRAEAEAAGRQQEKEAKAKAAADKLDKEKRDAQYKIDIAAARAAGERMQRDRARSGYLPPTAATSQGGDGACFVGADVERALRQFDEGTQALIDEGVAAVKGLDTVKRRAQGLPPE